MTSSNINRYSFDSCQCGCGEVERHVTTHGPYVTYEDYKSLEDREAGLRSAHETRMELIKVLQDEVERLNNKIKEHEISLSYKQWVIDMLDDTEWDH